MHGSLFNHTDMDRVNTSRANEYVLRLFEFLADVESKYEEALFHVAILIYVILLLNEAVGYSSDARLLPLSVGVTMVGMILFHLASLLIFDSEGSGVDFAPDTEELQSLTEETETGSDDMPLHLQHFLEFTMILWTGLFIILIWAIGFLYAVGAFILVFVYAYERDLRRAVIVSALTTLFIQLLFIELLSVRLYEGELLFIGLYEV